MFKRKAKAKGTIKKKSLSARDTLAL